MMPEHAWSTSGFKLVHVTLFDQAIAAVDVRPPEGSTLDFERPPAGPPGDRLLDLVSVVRHAVRRKLLVLLPGLRIREIGAGYDGPYTFVWSVGDCTGLLLQDDSGPRRLLIGRREQVRYVRSYLEPAPSSQDVIDSPTVCTDYRDFASLWTDRDKMEEEEAADGFRWLDMIALGKGIGDAHSHGVLHGDLHEGNVAIDAIAGRVTAFDLSRARFLYGPAESAECATDLLPLMRGFTSWDWYNFKRGYLNSWPDGDRVFDLIQSGDRTGWMQAKRRQDYQLTLALIDEAQQLVDVDAVAELAPLADGRAWCYYNLGENELAVRAQTEAITLAERNRLPDLGLYILKLALLYRDTGHAELAASTLADFLARTDHAADNEQAVEMGKQIMESIRAERGQNLAIR